MRRPLLAAGLVALLAAVGVPSALSKPRRRPPVTRPPSAEELQNLWGEATAEEARLVSELDSARAAKLHHARAASRLAAEVRRTERRLTAVEAELQGLEATRGELQIRLSADDALVADARRELTEVLVALYHRGGQFPVAFHAAMLLDSHSPHDLFAAARYLREAAEGREREMERFIELRRVTESLKSEVTTKSEEVATVRAGLAEEREQLDAVRAEQLAAAKAATTEATREAKLLTQAQSRREQAEKDLARFYADSSNLAEWLRTRQAKQRQAPQKRKTFQAPVKARVTSPFGPRMHPIIGELRLHAGVDYDVGAGSPVGAGGAGTIAWAAPRGGYGNLVVVDHGNGLATLYAHLSKIEIRAGEVVKPGQVVGRVGSTGLSTGPHLHFEVRVKGTPVDPLRYL